MSKIAKKLQKAELLRINTEKAVAIANKNRFTYCGFDDSNSKVSFYDQDASYRFDVFATTMTIGVISMLTRGDQVFYRNQTFEDLEKLMIRHNINRRKLKKGY